MFGRRSTSNEQAQAGSIGGVYAAAVTPHRREGYEADYGAMLELVDHLAQAGVDGICLLGSTGEFLHIKPAERIRLVHLAVKRSRVPILAGVSHSTLDGAIELADEAVISGAQGLLLMPPYFFRYEAPEITEFYRRFADSVDNSIPLLLYNIPQFSNGVPLECARELLTSGLYAGIKDSSGDQKYFDALAALKAEHDFVLMCGNDRLMAHAVHSGANGAVSGVACAVPEVVVQFYRALKLGDVEKTAHWQRKLDEFIGWIDRFPAPLGVKTATAVRGRTCGPPSVPLAPENSALLEEFQTWFRGWLPSVAPSSVKAR